MKTKFLLLMLLILPVQLWAQTPLPVNQDTVALWNFDSDVDDTVIDGSTQGLNGTAYNAAILAIPDIDTSFGPARKFVAANSFIDLGTVLSSPLDFTGQNELSIEAIIHLTSGANSTHMIVNLENVRLFVLNNQLAAAVRQPGGLYGLTAETALQIDQTYRVGLHFKFPELILTINGRTVSRVTLTSPIQAPSPGSTHAFIGGDILGRYFPGYIDDVRVSSSALIDTEGPTITLVEPSSTQISDPRPNFEIELSDNVAVDPTAVSVYLNNELQSGLTISATEISGQLEDEMVTGVLNEVKVVAYDTQGNFTEKKINFTFSSVQQGGEYEVDANTLGLWHMNDFSPWSIQEETTNARHAVGYAYVAEGVFGNGRTFQSGNSIYSFDAIRFPGKKFTIEGWFNPTLFTSAEAILFQNGQIKFSRLSSGAIRVTFFTSAGTLIYTTTASLLPVGEWHHIAVTWDGEKENKNLVIYQDGLIKEEINAIYDCEFNSTPQIGQIGSAFDGKMDELRFSSNVRLGFNIPASALGAIEFATLQNGTSVDEAYPHFEVNLQSPGTINVNDIKVKVNGVIQSATSELTISPTQVSGKFASALNVGLNEIEVSFLDADRSLKKKKQFVFYIKKLGGKRLESDSSTLGLWHFESSVRGLLADSSSRNIPLTSTLAVTTPGVVGTGVLGNNAVASNFPMNCQSVTMEGFFKSPGNSNGFQALFWLNSPRTNQYVNMNPANGAIQIRWAGPGGTIDTVIPNAFPVDSAYHHVATVYDHTRGFSQLLLLVDGKIVQTFDVPNSCLISGNTSLLVGNGVFVSDEFTVSKTAKYSFNLMKTGEDRPVLLSSTPAEGDTVSGEEVPFTFTAEDTEGMDVSQTKLYANDVEVPISASNKSGDKFSTTFTATVPLIYGSNYLTLHMVDLNGNSQVKVVKIYRFDQGTYVAYTPDSDTSALLNFDQITGDFTDSSSNGYSVPRSMFSTTTAGIFNQAVVTNGGAPYFTTNDFGGKKSWSVEGWMLSNTNTGYFFWNNFCHLNLTSNTAAMINYSGHQVSVPPVPLDGQWHHIAVVVDENQPIDKVYYVLDGKVKAAFSPPTLFAYPSSFNFYFAYGIFGYFDEYRFSKVPRYELVSEGP